MDVWMDGWMDVWMDAQLSRQRAPLPTLPSAALPALLPASPGHWRREEADAEIYRAGAEIPD